MLIISAAASSTSTSIDNFYFIKKLFIKKRYVGSETKKKMISYNEVLKIFDTFVTGLTGFLKLFGEQETQKALKALVTTSISLAKR